MPGPTHLQAPNQSGLRDHCFGRFPNLLLQWQSAAFSMEWSWESVVACPGKEHRVAEGTQLALVAGSQACSVTWQKMVPETDYVHHHICCTCPCVCTCPLQLRQKTVIFQAEKPNLLGFLHFHFLRWLDVLLPLPLGHLWSIMDS